MVESVQSRVSTSEEKTSPSKQRSWIRENEWYSISELLGPATPSWWYREVKAKSERIKRDLHLRHMPLSVDGGQAYLRAEGIAGELRLFGRNIQVIPKFIEDELLIADWQETILTMLARAHRREFTYSPLKKIKLRPVSFVDHMALAYIDALKSALKQEPIHTYKVREEINPYIRGRLSIERQLQILWTQPHKLHCEVDYLDTNNQFNRLLLWGIQRFVSLVKDDQIKRRLFEMYQEIPSVSDVSLGYIQFPLSTPAQFEHYREAIEIASVLARGYSHGQSSGPYDSYGYLLNMEKLFETFVARSLALAIDRLGSPYHVVAQHSHLYAVPKDHNGKAYYTRPDNVVMGLGNAIQLVIDAKYKALSDSDEGSLSRPKNSDVYQLFASCVSHKCQRGMLVHPKMVSDEELRDGKLKHWEVIALDSVFDLYAQAFDFCHLRTKQDLKLFDDALYVTIGSLLGCLQTIVI